MVTTAIGFSLSFFLALYKYEIGHKLQSLTITAGDSTAFYPMHSWQNYFVINSKFNSNIGIIDATSSLCSGLTSLSALVVTILDPYFWWADSGTGGLVALYTLYKGISTMIHSMVSYLLHEKDFNSMFFRTWILCSFFFEFCVEWSSHQPFIGVLFRLVLCNTAQSSGIKGRAEKTSFFLHTNYGDRLI